MGRVVVPAHERIRNGKREQVDEYSYERKGKSSEKERIEKIEEKYYDPEDLKRDRQIHELKQKLEDAQTKVYNFPKEELPEAIHHWDGQERINPEAQKAIITRAQKHYDEWNIKVALDSTKGNQSEDSISVWGETNPGSAENPIIYLNAGTFNTPEMVQYMGREDDRDNTSREPADVFTHEFGHVLHLRVENRGNSPALQKLLAEKMKARSEDLESDFLTDEQLIGLDIEIEVLQERAIQAHAYSELIQPFAVAIDPAWNRMIDEMGQQEVVSLPGIVHFLSAYAAANPFEGMAEAFTKWQLEGDPGEQENFWIHHAAVNFEKLKPLLRDDNEDWFDTAADLRELQDAYPLSHCGSCASEILNLSEEPFGETEVMCDDCYNKKIQEMRNQ